MGLRSLPLTVVAMAIIVGVFSPDALAIGQRSFVRSDGVDTDACSLLQPCRSFTAALLKTNPGGEIIVLDSAGYGPVTIGQSVSIIAPLGIYAGVTVFTGDGIAINGDNGAIVVLRGLTINGQGGNSGIRLQQGARLHVEGCQISNMGADGISIEAAGADVFVNDSTARENAGNGVGLIAAATVVIDRLRSERNGNGVVATNGRITIRDSVISRNGFYGIAMNIFLTPTTNTLTVEDSMIVGNGGDGIRAVLDDAPPGTLELVVSRNSIIDNDWGVNFCACGSATVIYGSVTDNVIKGFNQVGIIAQGSGAKLTISGNTVTRGSVGIKQTGGATFQTRGSNSVTYNGIDLDPLTTLTSFAPL